MADFKNPFSKNISAPGRGEVHITLLPPAKPSYSTLNYTYPLKLIPSYPHTLSHAYTHPTETSGKDDTTNDGIALDVNNGSQPAAGSAPPAPVSITESVPLLFILSYGGGLLPPDSIDLSIRLDPGTRLTLATQGSTKIYPSRPFQSARTAASSSDGGSATDGNIDPTITGTDAGTSQPNASDPEAPLPIARQMLRVHLGPHSALCLTPDPTQPFAGSRYIQEQSFTMHPSASLLLLDWTTEGRRARGESWDALLWRGCNEVWRLEEGDGQDEFISYPAPPHRPRPSQTPSASSSAAGLTGPGGNGAGGDPWSHVPGSTKIRRAVRNGRRLQLRDQVILEASAGEMAGGALSGGGMDALKADGVGCFGTLICVGDVLRPLADFFVQEFEALPRIGGRKWEDDDDDEGKKKKDKDGGDDDETDDSEEARRRRRQREREAWRARRLKLEADEKVLWNAARVRGLVMVKFTARDAQGARHWLGQMLTFEGTVLREFGPGGLMSIR